MNDADATLIMDKLDTLQGTLTAIKIAQAGQRRHLKDIHEGIAQLDDRPKRLEAR